MLKTYYGAHWGCELLEDLSAEVKNDAKMLDTPLYLYDADNKDFILTRVVDDYIDSGRYVKHLKQLGLLDEDENPIVSQKTREMMKTDLYPSYKMYVDFLVDEYKQQQKMLKEIERVTPSIDEIREQNAIKKLELEQEEQEILSNIENAKIKQQQEQIAWEKKVDKAVLFLIPLIIGAFIIKVWFGVALFGISVLVGFVAGTMKDFKRK